jgi:hypothetical protein
MKRSSSSKTEMLFAVVTLSMIGLAPSLLAEADTRAGNAAESAKENTQEAGRDLGKNSRKIGRKAEEKACPLVNGKIDCTKQEIENDVKNTSDDVEDKLNEPRRQQD